MDRVAVLKSLNLPKEIREYWEANIAIVRKGFMTQGKFERYFRLFRRTVLPLVHTRREVRQLLAPKTESERRAFYEKVWDNRRWKIMFRIFFSRFVMGRLGRDKEFFKFVEGSVASRILSRCKHALSTLDTSVNPYAHFILCGEYGMVFPYSLREENYGKIRENLDRIEFRKVSLEQFIAEFAGKINAFNLSDIFEYMTQDGANALYEAMLNKAVPGARFAYWNMLAPRKCSDKLCAQYGVQTDERQNAEYLLRDKAFFYSKFYLDKVGR